MSVFFVTITESYMVRPSSVTPIGWLFSLSK